MQISLVLGDIVDQDVDVVVNAANSGLMGGGGVDGAILRAGGDVAARRPASSCATGSGRWPTGHAAAPTAGDMRCHWVVHVVGPVFSRREDRSELLASCYREALGVADRLGAPVVAFPAVSAGIYGWPMASAADIAVAHGRATPTDIGRGRAVRARSASRRTTSSRAPSVEP